MMSAFIFLIFSAFYLTYTSSKIQISLGSKDRLQQLFSYPNTGHEDQTLEETISIWLKSTLNREGYTDSSIEIIEIDGNYTASVQFPEEKVNHIAFKSFYEKFLEIGEIGLNCSKSFKEAGKWNETWRFLLPLGLAMQNSLTIEMMNAPPLSLLTEQDYLNSQTTKRWKELLVYNGADTSELDLYSSILDIVPVATAAADGRYLDQSGIYEGPFNEYTFGLLSLWGHRNNPENDGKPLVAFGAPITKWIERNFGVKLKITEVTQVLLKEGVKIPVISSNHPSYFFYGIRKGSDFKGKVEEGLRILKEDIVVACWQVRMGKNTDMAYLSVLEECKENWSGKEKELIEIVIRQGGLKLPDNIEENSHINKEKFFYYLIFFINSP